MSGKLKQADQLLCGLRGHDVVRHFEPNRLSLRCLSCGYQTAGWNLQLEASDFEKAQNGHARGTRAMPILDGIIRHVFSEMPHLGRSRRVTSP